MTTTTAGFDIWAAYPQMLRSRLFELAVKDLWEQGEISGEMHLGLGEEAVVAGVVMQLRDGDALALDHRGTPPLVMRGVDLVALLHEFLGRPEGLCGGQGGHLHLFAREQLAASSGIVGASGPAAAGFAFAAERLRQGAVAVAFFGEGAMNQGMLLESFNLASTWNLPVVFVCKDNAWAITTQAESVTGSDLVERAGAFGLHARDVDGRDVAATWRAAGEALGRARDGGGPSFIRARCVHIEGHFLGDPLLRIARRPVREMTPVVGPLTRALLKPGGASIGERARSLARVATAGRRLARDETSEADDPIVRARRALLAEEGRLEELEAEVAGEIDRAVEAVGTRS